MQAESAHSLGFDPDRHKVNSAFHPSKVSEMRAQIVGSKMLTLTQSSNKVINSFPSFDTMNVGGNRKSAIYIYILDLLIKYLRAYEELLMYFK